MTAASVFCVLFLWCVLVFVLSLGCGAFCTFRAFRALLLFFSTYNNIFCVIQKEKKEKSRFQHCRSVCLRLSVLSVVISSMCMSIGKSGVVSIGSSRSSVGNIS